MGGALAITAPTISSPSARCDGLDNDCDGTVDSSWTRTLLDADGGRYEALWEADVNQAQVVPGTAGHWISLPNDLLVLDDDLTVRSRTRFPSFDNGSAVIFQDGSEWLRIARNQPLHVDPNRVIFHRVFADAGAPAGVDGGPELLAEASWPTGEWPGPWRASPTDGGWAVVATFRGSYPGTARVALIRMDHDGGILVSDLDGGPRLASSQFPTVQTDGDRFVIWDSDSSGLASWTVDLDTSTAQPWVSGPVGCGLMTLNPLTSECWALSDAWRDP